MLSMKEGLHNEILSELSQMYTRFGMCLNLVDLKERSYKYVDDHLTTNLFLLALKLTIDETMRIHLMIVGQNLEKSKIA